jgi:Na+/phosphate symporter
MGKRRKEKKRKEGAWAQSFSSAHLTSHPRATCLTHTDMRAPHGPRLTPRVSFFARGRSLLSGPTLSSTPHATRAPETFASRLYYTATQDPPVSSVIFSVTNAVAVASFTASNAAFCARVVADQVPWG